MTGFMTVINGVKIFFFLQRMRRTHSPDAAHLSAIVGVLAVLL